MVWICSVEHLSLFFIPVHINLDANLVQQQRLEDAFTGERMLTVNQSNRKELMQTSEVRLWLDNHTLINRERANLV